MKIFIDKNTNKIIGLNLEDNIIQFAYIIEVPDDFDLTKEIQEVDTEKPLVQKTDSEGNLLYKDNVVINEVTGEETYDEVTYSRKPIEFEERQVSYKTIDENGQEITITNTVQVPVKWQDLDPVLIDNIVTKTISIKERPQEFTLDEVVQAKCASLLEQHLLIEYIIADFLLNESDFDLQDPNHSANTGVGVLELLPNGQAKTKSITLEVLSKYFKLLELDADEGVEVYIAGSKFVNGEVTLNSEVSTCTIKFVNTTNKAKVVRSYAIGY